jgi:Nitrate and nitrite sensing
MSTASAAPTRHQGGGTINGRVARILALPAVVVLVLLALLAAGQVADQRTSRATSASVQLALSVQDLVHELQAERGITAAVLGGNDSFSPELRPARALVDRQRTRLTDLVGSDDGAAAQIRSALARLDAGLEDRRNATDDGAADRAETFQFFTDRISALSSVDIGLQGGSDRQLRRGAAALQSLQDLTEATSQERAFLNGVFSAGGFAQGEFLQFAGMRADRESALERFNRFATPAQRSAGEFVFSTGAARLTAEFEQVALDAADGRNIVVNPQSWWSGLTTVLDDLRQLQEHVGSETQLRAHDLQVGSQRRIAVLLGAVLIGFAGSIYLTMLASRSITRPLAALAAEADSVAADRLPSAVRRLQTDTGPPPEPPTPVQVPDRATQEIKSVASALDRLQAAAYGLATDQAVQRRDTIESMANLGRRNQNLIRRQLGFITSLEREEIDPSALANLFELDHLATRMRRNAASLLVLVGASSPRQWSSAVSVADMIRAAVSEVEEYRRVALRRVDEAFVTGGAVGSIAHLLAELIENGLTFSPPDMEVEVQGRRLADGYLIAITDQGIGMSAPDLRTANSKLKGQGDFIATPTRFLGHFVVGKLARDTGVDVELLPSPVTGVTARITLPPALLSFPANSTPPDQTLTPASISISAVPDTGSTPRHSAQPVGLTAGPNTGPNTGPLTGPGGLTSRRLALPSDDADRTPPAGLPVPLFTPAVGLPGAGKPAGTPAYGIGRIPALTPTPRADPAPTAASAPAPTAAPTPAPAAAPAAEAVTVNGLRKRTPRSARTPDPAPAPERGRSAAAASRRVIDLSSAERPPAVDGSPAQVGARMTALRAGMQRGRTELANASQPSDGTEVPSTSGPSAADVEESE